MKELNYACMIPLVGGMTIANQQVTGKDPFMIMSYTPFASNDSHIVKRLSHVPYIPLDEALLPKYVPQLDFVSTVCPCAGLSSYSTAKKGHGAKQNEWMYRSAEEILSRLHPRVMFGENAPGLYSSMGEGVGQDLFEIAQKYGYSFSIYKTNTRLHGIPQNRPRTFYFFWDSHEAPIMPWFKREKLSLVEYLKQVPKDALYHTSRDIESKREHLFEDETWCWLHAKFGAEARQKLWEKGHASIYDFAVENGHMPEMIRWFEENGYEKAAKRAAAIHEKVQQGGNYWDNSMYIFKDEFNALIGRSMDSAHPVENRSITLREAMHLMGLPHDFELTDPKLAAHVTQNVPVTTAADMTRAVISFLNGELSSSGCKYFKQDNITETTINVVSNNSLEGFFS